ncbi:hypothetical protein K491DRAFT_603420 [Lophiostoma macrostomum CBS 122681]|uniref:DUF3176 domain containing protein n=1 Tax=Lophiostoma macrostomum CBS 122681 TaxID=1314788 RepID=A0A6A6SZK7_9PLEO|nr:hypothetical protein K491DRAFT_603420 [Lophiostoma macrostomum CBS 122681]
MTSNSTQPSEHICPKCSVNSRDQPIHCISVSAAPPPYASVAPQIPAHGRLAVPSLNVQTGGQWSNRAHPHRPAPAFRPNDDGRHIRFRHNAFSPVLPQTPQRAADSSRPGHIGLGIPAAPFKPDISPITPGSVEKAQTAKETTAQEESSTGLPGASNFAQRIEERLWKYSASRNVVKRWLMEIISWSLSALCIAAIVIVLHHYQHQPLPKWPLGLTLNAYISVLAKFASAALLLPVSEALGQLKWSWFQTNSGKDKQSKKMWDFELFDNASRGPWGSFMLLLRTRGRSLAALGAAVTLFALAMDPFFQQVVSFPENWQIQPLNGSIPCATTYQIDSAGMLEQDGIRLSEPDQAMSATAYHYFYENGTNPATSGSGNKIGTDVPLTCPSSKCTWDQYESLSVCNRCVQNTDLLEFGCRDTVLDWISTPTPTTEHTAWVYPNGTACGWFLRARDSILMTGYITGFDGNYIGDGEVLLSRSQPLYDLNTRAPLPGYKAKLNNTRNPITHFVVVSGGEDLVQIQRNATPIAHECIITWCVKTLQSSLSGGLYSENVTEVFYNHTLGPEPWTVSQTFDDGELVSIEFTYNENVTIVGNSGHSYKIDNTTHNTILTIFDDIFPSTYTMVNSTNSTSAAPTLRFQQYFVSKLMTRIPTYNPFLYNNITLHLDNLADDLTNIMRSSKATTQMTPGAAFDLVSVVLVRWEWLSLPLGLLGFTFIFLVSTIVRSSMDQDVGVWKTSAIATLLYGLPDDVRKKVTSRSIKDHGTPRANAKHTRIKWLPGAGWRLSGASVFSPSSLRSRHTPPQAE